MPRLALRVLALVKELAARVVVARQKQRSFHPRRRSEARPRPRLSLQAPRECRWAQRMKTWKKNEYHLKCIDSFPPRKYGVPFDVLRGQANSQLADLFSLGTAWYRVPLLVLGEPQGVSCGSPRPSALLGKYPFGRSDYGRRPGLRTSLG